MGLSVFFVAFW